MALACTATANWNHGASGPSRYAIWLFPFLFYAFAVLGGVEAVPGRPYRWLAGLALAVQAAIVLLRGGMLAPADDGKHSYAARLVLDRWPALYNPSHEIFVNRTREPEGSDRGPYVYKHGEECRKALAKPKHGDTLRLACGRIPEGYEGFFASSEADEKRWNYVNY